ncbi:MAG: hypothetical protein IJZ83_08975 [Clostridia bacterium]|nr:hypothetical protein [Clostridia bacterium]MBR4012933.1 hypothetical protein [Clostridia bacterium]
MADIQYYERIIKTENTTKKVLPKILMIGAYIVILSIWFVIAVRYSINAAMIMLIPLSILTAVLLTWKYTSVEYEYSFTAGIFTFSKIYGKSKRKPIFEGDLKKLISVTAYSESNVDSIDAHTVINATPSACPNPCVCIFEENERKTCIIIDCDAMTAKILRFFKVSAVDRSVFYKIKRTVEDNDA